MRVALCTDRFNPQRRAAVEAFFESIGEHVGLAITPFTRDLRKAKRWLNDRQVSVDGVVVKPLCSPYQPGERAMLKVKRLRTADWVVGGFRFESGRKMVGVAAARALRQGGAFPSCRLHLGPLRQ
jgi:ATP-dependent DNA ligase